MLVDLSFDETSSAAKHKGEAEQLHSPLSWTLQVLRIGNQGVNTIHQVRMIRQRLTELSHPIGIQRGFLVQEGINIEPFEQFCFSAIG